MALKFLKSLRNFFIIFSVFLAIFATYQIIQNVFSSPAATVQFTADVIIDLVGNPITLYAASTSEATSLEIGGKVLRATISAGETFLLKTSTYKVLRLIPTGGPVILTFNSDYFQTGYLRQWQEESNISSTNVAHLVGVPKANTYYTVNVNGVKFGTYLSDANKEVTFTYNGGYSVKTFAIGEAPTISSVSDSPDPGSPAGIITFSSNASPANAGDTIKLYICNDANCTNCNAVNQTGCRTYSTTGASSNPSATLSCPGCGEAGLSGNYWAQVCDQNGFCSTIISGGSWSCESTPTCNVAGWAWSNNLGWISFNCSNQAAEYASWSSATGIMSGYAWSDNIGWVSFNCADNKVCSTTNRFCVEDADCPTGETCVDTRDGCTLVSNYKVTIHPTSGELSGYAWSDSLGWLSFNRTETGAPPAAPYNGTETYTAKKVGAQLTGWAKFLAAGSGWDGWLKLACYSTECQTSNYSVYVSGSDIGGWAWGSDVVGWLSFGGVCPVNYGTHISSGDYSLSGYAWSENLGWLSFQKVDTGIPPAPPFNNNLQTYIAKLDPTNCKFRGWARFLSQGGGWTGWLKLQREGGTPDYTVSLNAATNEFEGWAWSEAVVGWLAFNDKSDGTPGPIDYQVTTTIASPCGPSCSGLNENLWDKCVSSKYPTLSWTCSETQTGREIEIKAKGAAASCAAVDFSTGLLIDTGEQAIASSSYVVSTDHCVVPGCDLSWNTTYCWRVRCQAASGWSNWCLDPDGFTTPLNAYPAKSASPLPPPDSGQHFFTWSPWLIRTNENVTFTDKSQCFASPCTFAWTFEDTDFECVDPATGCQSVQNPVVKWKTRGDGIKTVTLQVTDASGYTCSETRNATIIRYPKWREIIPW